METYDIAVIGGGAAGLSAAIFAAAASRSGGRGAPARVVVLDGAAALGKKILISGGGRCNVTHATVSERDFNGSQKVIRNILAAFDVAATRAWFDSLGVPLVREDTGKLFPASDSARTVLAALLRRCAALDVALRPGHRVTAVGHDPAAASGPFMVRHAHGELGAARLVVATGGCSLPRTGSDGSGWDLVRHLGHSVSDVYPALVPLVLRAGMFHAALSGLSHPAELRTFADGTQIDRRSGSLLWTHFGISGPVVLDASRHWVVARGRGQAVALRCNVLPELDFAQAHAWLKESATQRPRLSLGRCLAQRLPERLAHHLAASADCDPGVPLGQVTRLQHRAMAHALTHFPLPVERDRGWDFAEVTAGGVPLHEIDYRTMESRVVPGLYLVGELLDCDGRIGGFNFQWAWATGRIAGHAAARL
jgi:hypothetical protein